MIEIRELIIKAVITKNTDPGGGKGNQGGKGADKGNSSDQFDQLMEVLKDQNER